MDLRERPHRAIRRHPWEVARFRFFERVLERAGAIRSSARVLDVGAGDGWFAGELRARHPRLGPTTCWDAGYTPEVVESLGADVAPGLACVAERPRGAYELVLLLDVLEHVEDDRGFLGEVVRENVAPGGTILFSVPAWAALYTAHDERLRHFRRYAPASAAAVLEGAGLEILAKGGLFHSLLPLRALAKLREHLLGRPSHVETSLEWRHGARLGAAVDAFLRVDNALSHRLSDAGLDAPGLSFWALCRKR